MDSAGMRQEIQEEIERLQTAYYALGGNAIKRPYAHRKNKVGRKPKAALANAPTPIGTPGMGITSNGVGKKSHTMSKKARKAISVAMKARWAKVRSPK